MPAPYPKLTPEQFEAKAESYFQHCLDTDESPTVTGLAWHLGFASRQSVWEYGKRDGYEHAVKRAMLFVEYGYEKQMANGRGDGGLIFALKNLGWSDKQELEHTSPDGSMSPNKIELVAPDLDDNSTD